MFFLFQETLAASRFSLGARPPPETQACSSANGSRWPPACGPPPKPAPLSPSRPPLVDCLFWLRCSAGPPWWSPFWGPVYFIGAASCLGKITSIIVSFYLSFGYWLQQWCGRQAKKPTEEWQHRLMEANFIFTIKLLKASRNASALSRVIHLFSNLQVSHFIASFN